MPGQFRSGLIAWSRVGSGERWGSIGYEADMHCDCGRVRLSLLHNNALFYTTTHATTAILILAIAPILRKSPLCFGSSSDSTDLVGFLNDLIERVGRTCVGLADKRRGKNLQFSMRDIGLAGFSPFFMQCPLFLSHQRQICEGIGHGRSNCQTLVGMEHIPSDNHIRTMLDEIEPSILYRLFDDALAAVETAGALPSLTSLDGYTLIAVDGD